MTKKTKKTNGHVTYSSFEERNDAILKRWNDGTPTCRDVADACGVSPAVVSNVLFMARKAGAHVRSVYSPERRAAMRRGAMRAIRRAKAHLRSEWAPVAEVAPVTGPGATVDPLVMKAMAAPQRLPLKTRDSKYEQLALAWARGSVSLTQVAHAIGIDPSNSKVYRVVAFGLRHFVARTGQ